MIPSKISQKSWIFIFILALHRDTTADNPIILPPTNLETHPAIPDIILSSPLAPSPTSQEPVFSPSPPPSQVSILSSYPTQSPSPPYQGNDTIANSTSHNVPPNSRIPEPSPPFTHTDPSRTRTTERLSLVHVPLKVSCDILRRLYNSTGGTNWSNQDGWQYVDSVTIPTAPPNSHPYLKRDNTLDYSHHFSNNIKKRKHDDDRDDDFSTIISPNHSASHSVTNGAAQHRGGDGGGRSSSSPSPSPPSSDNTDMNGGGDDTIGDTLITAGNLDPDNCCGWYGVVCIGPDGIIPPPWPPYDDDLVMNNNHPQVEKRRLRQLTRSRYDLHHQSQKKRSVPGPYYNYQYHHPKEGGDGRGGGSGDNGRGSWGGRPRGTGGVDNRHSPEDGNNEGGYPSMDQQSSDNGNNNPPIALPPMNYGDQRGSDRRLAHTDDWYIIELHLGFNGLSGPVPEELGRLVNLMILDISNNELAGQIPASFSNLTRLRRFDISSNLITGTFPMAVTRMPSIQELVLKNNYLTGSLPLDILKLKQLTELSIANNEFDGMLPQGFFSSLTKLKVVNINQNGFTGELGAEIGELGGLLKFSARANEFRGRIPKELGNCKQIESINLGDNHFLGEIPESIYNLQNLRVLDIPANRLTGPISPNIGNMKSLTRLILSHNEFSGPLPVEIQNLTRLEYMVLNYNNFDGNFPIAIAPPLMTVCLVQPNSFTSCPPNSSIETSTTLAYQCNLDCRDRVIHPEIYDAISQATSSYTIMWRRLLLLSICICIISIIL